MLKLKLKPVAWSKKRQNATGPETSVKKNQLSVSPVLGLRSCLVSWSLATETLQLLLSRSFPLSLPDQPTI